MRDGLGILVDNTSKIAIGITGSLSLPSDWLSVLPEKSKE
jgi:hypothetical protein